MFVMSDPSLGASKRAKGGIMNTERPKVGKIVILFGKRCRIFKVRPAGTIDVVALDDSGAWRISGLAFS
jgi:hypothetical protein